MSEPIRILHVFGQLNIGGAESRIMDLYRKIDRTKVQFDFLIHLSEFHNEAITDDTPGSFSELVRSLGGRIYSLPRYRVYNEKAYRKAAHAFFQSHQEFTMIQGHMTSTASIYLPIAKEEYNAQDHPLTTIAHARSAGVSKDLRGLMTLCVRRNLRKRADYFFACSKEAGISVFGTKLVEAGHVRSIKNAIETERFVYSPMVRDEIRELYHIPENAFVVGHVGRFSAMKNHEYLVEIFADIYEKRKDAYLLLVGDGELRNAVERQVRELDQIRFLEGGVFTEHVIFAGRQRAIEKYYQAMDIFVFPSVYEGLPGTVVEAQTTGLPCFVSDKVTGECKVTDHCEFMSIDLPHEDWSSRILKHRNAAPRRSYQEEVRAAGFDVNEQSRIMMDFYLGNTDLSELTYR